MRPSDRKTGTVVLAVILALSGAAAARASVTYQEGKLSVRFEGAPADEVIREVEAAAPVRVRAPEMVRRRRLTATFHDVTLDDAMARILRGLAVENHAVLLDPDDGRRTYVVLDGGGVSGPVEPAALPPAIGRDGDDGPPEPVTATPEGVAEWRSRFEQWQKERDGSLVVESVPSERKIEKRRHERRGQGGRHAQGRRRLVESGSGAE